MGPPTGQDRFQYLHHCRMCWVDVRGKLKTEALLLSTLVKILLHYSLIKSIKNSVCQNQR